MARIWILVNALIGFASVRLGLVTKVLFNRLNKTDTKCVCSVEKRVLLLGNGFVE